MRCRVTVFVLLASLLAAAPTGAIVLHAVDNQALYALDTSDYSVTLIGSYRPPLTILEIGGLAYHQDGTLYGVSAGVDAGLYILDPTDGSSTLVGALGDFLFEGGLAFDPANGVLYAVNGGSQNAPRLSTIDISTGAVTDVGLIAGGDHDFAGLAFDQTGRLYGIDNITDALWRIDKTNPSGSNTVQIGSGIGGGIDMGMTGGMTLDAQSGVYYAYAGGSMDLFTVDLASGTGAVLQNLSAQPLFRALAYPNEIPVTTVPATWGRLKTLYGR